MHYVHSRIKLLSFLVSPEYLEFYLLISFFSQLGSLQCCSTLSIEMSLKFKILVTICILVLTLNVFFLRLGVGHVGWRSVLTSIMNLQRSGHSRYVVDHNVVTSHIKVSCHQNNNEKWPISWHYLKYFKIHHYLPPFPCLYALPLVPPQFPW